jgi:DNA-binding response OmpR family regulator
VKSLFIGRDKHVAEVAALSVRMCWQDASWVTADSATGGLKAMERELPDLVFIYPDFEDSSLLETIKNLRLLSNVPLIVFARQDNGTEATASLDMGADDYIRAPWKLSELIARVFAVMRRAKANQTLEENNPSLKSGSLIVCPAINRVLLDNRRIGLNSTEFRLLYLLVKNRSAVVSHQTLNQTLWGEQVSRSGLEKKYIQRLRGKLGDDAREPRWIASIHGVGYRFIGPEPTEVKLSAVPQ